MLTNCFPTGSIDGVYLEFTSTQLSRTSPTDPHLCRHVVIHTLMIHFEVGRRQSSVTWSLQLEFVSQKLTIKTNVCEFFTLLVGDHHYACIASNMRHFIILQLQGQDLSNKWTDLGHFIWPFDGVWKGFDMIDNWCKNQSETFMFGISPNQLHGIR
jgi:hypothetical protein